MAFNLTVNRVLLNKINSKTQLLSTCQLGLAPQKSLSKDLTGRGFYKNNTKAGYCSF